MAHTINEKNMIKARRLIALGEDTKKLKGDKLLLRAGQFYEEAVEWLSDVVQKKNRM